MPSFDLVTSKQIQDSLEGSLPEAFRRGLSSAHISGRAQIVHDISSVPYDSYNASESSCGDLIFYLDGAHSPESMEVCAKWFSGALNKNENSLISSFKVRNMDDIHQNGHDQLEAKNVEGSCKISKQASSLYTCNYSVGMILSSWVIVGTCDGWSFSPIIYIF